MELHTTHLYGDALGFTEGSAVDDLKGQSCVTVKGCHGNDTRTTTGDEWAIATGHTELWNKGHTSEL